MAWTGSRFLLTPHKLAMCILLNAVGQPQTSPTSLLALSSHSRHKLVLLLLQFFKASGGLLEPSYEELEHKLESSFGAGCGFSEEFRNLLRSFSSVEDLLSLFLSLRELLAAGQSRAALAMHRVGDGDHLIVEPSSTLGIFIRRCILSFNELTFEGTCRLFRELQSFCELVGKSSGESFQHHDFLDEEDLEDSNSCLERQSGGLERDVYGGIPRASSGLEIYKGQDDIATGGFFPSDGGCSSRKRCFPRTSGEVGGYLTEQAVMVEKNRSLERIFSDGPFSRLFELKELAFHLPQVHYLQYLDRLFQKDYPAAMESLHRFFDSNAGEVRIPGSSITICESGVGRLQAGLLGLGQMHSHLGHVTMALQALSESILIAQQNNDNGCLLHALAALCNLFSEVGILTDDNERCKWITPPGLDPEYKFYPAPEQHIACLLKRCLRRATELKSPQLIGFSRLAIAKMKLQHVHKIAGGVRLRNSLQFGTSPVEVCKILRINGPLLGNFESNGLRIDSALSLGRNAHTDLTTASGQTTAMSGPLGTTGWAWDRPNGKLGGLARSVLKLGGTSQLLRASSWEHYGCEPLVRASVLVHIACYSDVASADDLSLAYVKLVKLLSSLKGHSLSHDALALVGKRFPLMSKSRVRTLQLQCMIERALLQGEYNSARIACGELLALASVVSGVDMALKIQASSYNAQIQLAGSHYKEAAVSAHRLFSLCFKGNMQRESIESLILMADIHKIAGNAVTGLPYVLAALTLCQSLNLDLLHASAIVTLAELWLGLGMFPGRRALVLLQQCMPVVLGHASLQLRVRANLAIAQCYLSDPTFSVEAEPNTVLQPLQDAVQYSQITEDLTLATQSLYLQAVVLDALGLVTERDEAALSFKRCMLRTNAVQTSKVAMGPGHREEFV